MKTAHQARNRLRSKSTILTRRYRSRNAKIDPTRRQKAKPNPKKRASPHFCDAHWGRPVLQHSSGHREATDTPLGMNPSTIPRDCLCSPVVENELSNINENPGLSTKNIILCWSTLRRFARVPVLLFERFYPKSALRVTWEELGPRRVKIWVSKTASRRQETQS